MQKGTRGNSWQQHGQQGHPAGHRGQGAGPLDSRGLPLLARQNGQRARELPRSNQARCLRAPASPVRACDCSLKSLSSFGSRGDESC